MKRYSRNCILSINIDKGRLDQVKEIKEQSDLIFKVNLKSILEEDIS